MHFVYMYHIQMNAWICICRQTIYIASSFFYEWLFIGHIKLFGCPFPDMCSHRIKGGKVLRVPGT